jgi:hypothetical protein
MTREEKGESKMSNKAESPTSQTAAAAAAVMAPEKVTPEKVSDAVPSQDDIAVLAYFYWEARGCPDGSAEEDWLRAEQELFERIAQRTE